VFFAAEMCVKVLAMGLVGKSTYLAETWNCLDMFIIVTGSERFDCLTASSPFFCFPLISGQLNVNVRDV